MEEARPEKISQDMRHDIRFERRSGNFTRIGGAQDDLEHSLARFEAIKDHMTAFDKSPR